MSPEAAARPPAPLLSAAGRILLLHSIAPARSPNCITGERFRYLAARNSGSLITFDDGYQDIHPALSQCPPDIARRTIVFLVAAKVGGTNDWDSSGPLAGRPLLNWDQIHALREQGVRFGSHGLTHADLTTCDDGQLARELRESQDMLEDKLQAPIKGFSYPYGSFDQRVKIAVARCYRWAVAARYTHRPSDRYALPRIGFAGNSGELLFRLKSSFLWLYDLRVLFEPSSDVDV